MRAIHATSKSAATTVGGGPPPLPGDGGAATGTSSRASDELVGQQVAAGGEHLTEHDEGDAAFFDCQPDGVGQAGATIRGAELGPASAPQVGGRPRRTRIRPICE